MMGDMPSNEAISCLLKSIRPLLIQNVIRRPVKPPFELTAKVGNSCLKMLVHVIDDKGTSIISLDFDEAEVVELARSSGKSVGTIFEPYLRAIKNDACSRAIGIGYELSLPTATDDTSLTEAGIAIYSNRSNEKSLWQTRQLMLMVGH